MAGPRGRGRVYVVDGVEEIAAAEFQEVIVDLRKFLPFSLYLSVTDGQRAEPSSWADEITYRCKLPGASAGGRSAARPLGQIQERRTADARCRSRPVPVFRAENADSGRLPMADSQMIFAAIATLRSRREAGIQVSLFGSHAGEGSVQHGLQGRVDRDRGVGDRGDRSTLGPAGPRVEPGESPSGPPPTQESLGPGDQPFVAQRVGGRTRQVVSNLPCRFSPPAMSQRDSCGQ